MNGLKRWMLLRRSHGLYLYEELTLEDEVYDVDEAGRNGPVVAHAYWASTHVSGLFDTIVAARQDARLTLLWLRSILASEQVDNS